MNKMKRVFGLMVAMLALLTMTSISQAQNYNMTLYNVNTSYGFDPEANSNFIWVNNKITDAGWKLYLTFNRPYRE